MPNRTRRLFTFDQALDAPPHAVFPLLCPVREYEWIKEWKCDLVYSDTGVAEEDCVFATDFPMWGAEVWVTTRYDPPHSIEFVKIGAWCALRYGFILEPAGGGQTLVRVRQVFTALNHEGDKRVAAMDQAGYEREKHLLFAKLAHFLGTGAMLDDGKSLIPADAD